MHQSDLTKRGMAEIISATFQGCRALLCDTVKIKIMLSSCQVRTCCDRLSLSRSLRSIIQIHQDVGTKTFTQDPNHAG
jgi:hypothetical protein